MKPKEILRTSAVIFKHRGVSGNWSEWNYVQKGDEVSFLFNGFESIVSIHGSGWLNDKLIMEPNDIIFAFDNISLHDVPDAIGPKLRGSLCVYVKVKDSFFILPDPLSGGMLFKYTSTNLIGYSSDIQSLLDVAIKNGEHPRKNIFYAAELACIENGGFYSSSYIEIEALEQFSYVKIHKHDDNINYYSVMNEFFCNNFSYEDLLYSAKKEILDNTRAIMEREIKKIAHITAGFDTRLSLSAFLENNFNKEDLLFFCSGDIQSIDKSIASQLCGHFGLTMTNYQGFSVSENNLKNTSGLLPCSIPEHVEQNMLIISGGYGECLRSFFSCRSMLPETYDPIDILSKIYGNMAFNSNSEETIISKNIYNDFIKLFAAFIDDATELGIRRDAILDYMYVNKRNRYYVGIISKYFSNVVPRVDPLYTLSGISLALKIPFQERQANIIGLDLMCSFYDELAQLPFDSDRVSGYEKYRTNISRKNYNGSYPIYLNETPKSGQQRTQNIQRNITQQHREKAKALNAALWQVVELENIQKEIKEIVSMKKNEISNVFNLKMVNRLAGEELTSRVHIRRAHSLCNVLKWFFF